MSGARESSRWRFLISPKWLGWHVFVILSVVGMLWLGSWQLHRAEAGNALSWAYTFEWPVFAIFGAVFWVKTVRDELRPVRPAEPTKIVLPAGVGAVGESEGAVGADIGPGLGPDDGEDDVELAEYNAYLAMLSKEHGLR